MTTGALVCPSCERSSFAIKQYEMPKFVLCLLVFWYQQRVIYTQCGSCMRKTILINALVNVLPGNLLWLLVLLPWYSVLFGLTFTRGHSSGVTG